MLLPLAPQRLAMTRTQQAFTIGDRLMTGVALLAALVALWSWLQAILAWGNPAVFSDALTWTVVTLVAFGVAWAFEAASNVGE